MSLLEKLKAGKKNKKTIKYPGTDQDIVVSILSEADIQIAHFEAERLFKKNGIEVSMSTVDAYEAEKTTQILFRACSDTEGSLSQRLWTNSARRCLRRKRISLWMNITPLRMNALRIPI